MKTKLLGVITARGGSKSIPRKNIKDLGGKPLIAWTIEAAKNSGIFDRIILSTDDGEIARIGMELGVEVPFVRPKELAQDDTPHLPVLQHAVRTLMDEEGYSPDYVAILQPTSPFRKPEDLKNASQILLDSNADSVISVVQIPGHSHPLWALKIDDKGFASLFATGEPVSKRVTRRQNLPPAYTHNGAIYIFKTSLLFGEEPNFYGEKVIPYIMKDEDSINIDTMVDWVKAQEKIKEMGL